MVVSFLQAGNVKKEMCQRKGNIHYICIHKYKLMYLRLSLVTEEYGEKVNTCNKLTPTPTWHRTNIDAYTDVYKCILFNFSAFTRFTLCMAYI